ncbi:MAG: hypothetical protein ABIC04_02125 [Nanoarchaeota archaeon]
MIELRIVMVIIGIMIVLAGALPFLSSVNLLSDKIPTTGPMYAMMVIAVGTFGFIYAVMNVTMLGPSKFVTICLAILTVLGGIIPFISSFLPAFIPVSFPTYNLMIILVGLIGVVYGLMSIG